MVENIKFTALGALGGIPTQASRLIWVNATSTGNNSDVKLMTAAEAGIGLWERTATGLITRTLNEKVGFGTTSAEIIADHIMTIKDPSGKGAIYHADYKTAFTDNSLVSKAYVDNVAGGLIPKNAVRAATTANITLSAPQTVDGVVLVADDRVLVKDQTTGSQNGIYDVKAGTWLRSSDMAATTTAGSASMLTENGTVNRGINYVQTADPSLVNTNALVFTPFLSSDTDWIRTGIVLSPFVPEDKLEIKNTLKVKPPDPVIIGDNFEYDVGVSNAAALVTNGHFLYTVEGSQLTIFDISNPSELTKTGSVAGLSGAGDIKVAGNYAYIVLTAGGNGFTIVDISDKSDPKVVATITDAVKLKNPACVDVLGKYAFISVSGVPPTTLNGAMTVIDISDPTNPFIASTIDNVKYTNALGIYALGNYVYMGSNDTLLASDSRLIIFDVTDPLNPKEASILEDSKLAVPFGVHTTGKYCYVGAQGDNSLTVVDVEDPENPSIASNVVNLNGISQIHVAGDFVYAGLRTGANSKVAMIDISDPKNPVLGPSITSSDFLYNVRFLWVSGKFCYASAQGNASATVYSTAENATVNGGASSDGVLTLTVVNGVITGIVVDTPGTNYTDGEIAGITGLASTADTGLVKLSVSGGQIQSATVVSSGIGPGKITVLDLGGFQVTSADIGFAELTHLSVIDNAEINNNLAVGSVNVGNRGLKSDGPLAGSVISTRRIPINANYTVKGNEGKIAAVDTFVAIVITLPKANTVTVNQEFKFKDESGNAEGNGITGFTPYQTETVSIIGLVSGANDATATITVDGAGLVQTATKVLAGTKYINGEQVKFVGVSSTADTARGTIVTSGDAVDTIAVTNGGDKTFPISILPNGSETIDGAANAGIVVDHASVTLYSNGSEWFSQE